MAVYPSVQGEFMKRLIYAISMTFFMAAFLINVSAQTRHSHNHWGGNSMNSNADAPGDNCDDHFNVTFDAGDTYTSEESQTLTPAQFAQGLTVQAAHNGGVLVRGWDKNEVLVKACKAVGADDDASAKSLLSELKMRIDGAHVSASGPDTHERDWTIFFLVNVPRNIKLALDAHNGPIDLRDVDGTVSASTVNGPLDIHRCSGQITAEATNGPIKVTRSSGNIHVHTTNGPVDVELAGNTWSGQGLDASAQNGPIKLHIPTGYKSGVEVESRGYSPFHCEQTACAGATKDWDDSNKSVRIGGSPTVVHLTTVNGPVSIVSAMQ
jgi:DUF4097 and DUF4098 domain-containing protein YvlB